MLPNPAWFGVRVDQQLRYPREMVAVTGEDYSTHTSYTEMLFNMQYFRATYDMVAGKIEIYSGENPRTATPFYTVSGVVNAYTIDFTFDQNERPVVVWTAGGFAFAYFFDSLLGDYATMQVAQGERVTCAMDYPHPEYITGGDADIQIFVQSGNTLTRYQQRSRYAIPYTMPEIPDDSLMLSCGFTGNLQFAVKIETTEMTLIAVGNDIVYQDNIAIGYAGDKDYGPYSQ